MYRLLGRIRRVADVLHFYCCLDRSKSSAFGVALEVEGEATDGKHCGGGQDCDDDDDDLELNKGEAVGLVLLGASQRSVSSAQVLSYRRPGTVIERSNVKTF
jgi:hypothetical protein